MDPLSSPFETLVLSYRGIFSLTTVSHFWTWIAILTAAISLWRIKTATVVPSRQKTKPPSTEVLAGSRQQNGSLPSPPFQTLPSPRTTPAATVSAERERRCETQTPVEDWREEEEDPSRGMETSGAGFLLQRKESGLGRVTDMERLGCVLCDEGRGKFAVYFDGEGHAGGGNGTEGAVKGFSFGGDYGALSCRLAPLQGRLLDLPWYSNLDLTVLNGNVVRLWDEVIHRTTPVECDSRRVMTRGDLLGRVI